MKAMHVLVAIAVMGAATWAHADSQSDAAFVGGFLNEVQRQRGYGIPQPDTRPGYIYQGSTAQGYYPNNAERILDMRIRADSVSAIEQANRINSQSNAQRMWNQLNAK